MEVWDFDGHHGNGMDEVIGGAFCDDDGDVDAVANADLDACNLASSGNKACAKYVNETRDDVRITVKDIFITGTYTYRDDETGRNVTACVYPGK